MNDLRCYCCGEELGLKFSLITMSNTAVDRVFLMKDEHVHKAEKDAGMIIPVARVRKGPQRRKK